jgi:biopolymer transport protein ExbD
MPKESRLVHKPITLMNLIPFMNLMSALIPFLLATAAFTSIAVIDINLPPSATPGKKKEDKPKKKEEDLVLTVLISDQGFTVGARGGFLPTVKKEGGKYSYEKLAEQLTKVKESFQDREEIIITSEPDIVYEVIIKVMDQCRENGFPNITIGAVQ